MKCICCKINVSNNCNFKNCTFQLNYRQTKMKWWFLVMGIALLQMAVFIENTEAKARDSDGDGISDVGKSNDVFSK